MTGALAAGFLTANSEITEVLSSAMGYIIIAVMIVMCLAAFYVLSITIWEYRNISIGLTRDGHKVEEKLLHSTQPHLTSYYHKPLFSFSSNPKEIILPKYFNK
jgi:hypothetical protein